MAFLIRISLGPERDLLGSIEVGRSNLKTGASIAIASSVVPD